MPQRERQRDQPLLRAVVEVALQPPALRVAGLTIRGREAASSARLGVGQRLGRELGELREPLLGAGAGTAARAATITAPHEPPSSTIGARDGAAEPERAEPLGERAGARPS